MAAPPDAPLRTLLVSDLHLGARGDTPVLRDPGCLRALCETTAGAGRLVLLGDVLELRERPLRDVLDDARPALEAIGSALAGREPAAEIVLLAGNHDHRLVEPWLRRRDRSAALGVDSEVAVGPGDPLAAVAAALGGDGGGGGARVRVRYPGTWLGERVWATHGHYADRHTTVPMLERIGAGAMARLADARDPRSAEDYEAALAPVSRGSTRSPSTAAVAAVAAVAAAAAAASTGAAGLGLTRPGRRWPGAVDRLAGARCGRRSRSRSRCSTARASARCAPSSPATRCAAARSSRSARCSRAWASAPSGSCSATPTGPGRCPGTPRASGRRLAAAGWSTRAAGCASAACSVAPRRTARTGPAGRSG